MNHESYGAHPAMIATAVEYCLVTLVISSAQTKGSACITYAQHSDVSSSPYPDGCIVCLFKRSKSKNLEISSGPNQLLKKKKEKKNGAMYSLLGLQNRNNNKSCFLAL